MKTNRIEPLAIFNFPKQRYKSVSSRCEETINYSTNDRTNRRGSSILIEHKKILSNYLDDIYLKYSTNLEKYFDNNRQGMRLTGNKYFDKFPQYFLFKERRERINEIISKLKEGNMSHLIGSHLDSTTDNFLTPLPNKSRQLITSNKELKEFQLAERVAVVMRVYEYTRGLKSKVGINEYYQLINDQKEQALQYLTNIVNRIGDWWKGIKRKRNNKKIIEKINKERIEQVKSQLIELQYFKYKQTSDIKRIEKGLNRLYNIIANKMRPIRKEVISKLKLLSRNRYKNKMIIYKGVKRNIENWFSQMMSDKNSIQRFSFINSSYCYKTTIKNQGMFITKQKQSITSFYKIILIQNSIKTLRKIKEKNEASSQIIFKPISKICYMYKSIEMIRIIHLRNLICLINQKNIQQYINELKGHFTKWLMIKINYQCHYKMKTHQLLFAKVISCCLLALIVNNYKWIFIQLISAIKQQKRYERFNSFLISQIKKKALSCIKAKALLKHLSKVLVLIIQKQSVNLLFQHWKQKTINIKTIITLIHDRLMVKHKSLFFDCLFQTDKSIISQCSKKYKGQSMLDNTFKYYCYAHSTKQENDFYYLRITFGQKILVALLTTVSHIKISFHQIKHVRKDKIYKNKSNNLWEMIKLNSKISSKKSQFKLTMNRIELIITNRMKSNVFHIIVLNHLLICSVNINNKGIISLLKQGKKRSYQKILDRIFDLNIIQNDWGDGAISFSSYVKKFLESSV